MKKLMALLFFIIFLGGCAELLEFLDVTTDFIDDISGTKCECTEKNVGTYCKENGKQCVRFSDGSFGWISTKEEE